jgi:rSAM/selenodomain-associated transferase 2
MISIIVPVLNEAERLNVFLGDLQSRAVGCEIILVDGGSSDATLAIAQELGTRMVSSVRGRAAQMNAGATIAQGEYLLFLHADTQLPEGFVRAIEVACGSDEAAWGRFDVRIDGDGAMLRIVAAMMCWRSRLTGIATGDQALFMHRALFIKMGGFPAIALMEDIAFCNAAKKISAPKCLRERVVTSGRRWQQRGVWRTILQMWWFRAAYFFGADPKVLEQKYYGRKRT